MAIVGGEIFQPNAGPGATTTTASTNPSVSLYGQDISNLGPSSYSGLPTDVRNNILGSLTPQLISSAQNYGSNIDDATNAATELYSSTANKSMGQAAQGILNKLAKKNILNSSVTGEAMGRGMSTIANEAATKGYESAITGAQLKAEEPNVLNNIVSQGQYSSSENQLAPYTLMSNIYSQLMG